MASNRSSLKAKTASQTPTTVDHSGPAPGNPPAGETRSVPSLEKESNTLDWLEALPDAALVVDERGAIRRANAIAATMFGCACDDLIGRPVETLMPERSRAGHGKHRAGFSAAQRPHPMGERRELQISRLDGTELSADISLSPLKLASGNFTLAILRDITKRKQAEQALKESESRFSSIVGTSKDGIIFFDGTTQEIIFGNDAMAEMLGSSKEELVGRTIPSLHSSEDWASVKLEFLKHVRGEISMSAAIPVLRNDGSIFYADITTSLITIEGRPFYSAFFRDITERKLAEEALRDSESKYRSLVNQSLLGILIVQNERTMYANDVIAEKSGYTADELMALSPVQLMELIHPGDREVVWNRMISRLSGNYEPEINEGRFVARDGTVYWTDVQTNIIEYEGKPALQLCILDITERKCVEETLAQERNLLRTLIDNLPDSIYVKDLESRFVLGNLEVTSLLGETKPEAIIGKKDFDFLPRDLAEQYYADEQNVLHTGNPLINREEIVEHQTTGKKFWNLVTKVPLRDGEGNIVGLVGIGRDITKRKEVEEALRESEERFRRLSEAAFEAIAIHDAGFLISANDQYFEMFGYQPEELLGKQALELTIAPEALEASRKEIASGKLGPYESIGMNKDGTRFPIEIRARVMEYEGRKVRVSVSMDISERKRAEDQLRKRTEELATLNRIGQAFSRLAPPSEILELLYTNIGQVLDNRNLYIALYDEASQSISFPVYTIDGERATPITRPFGNGLTEYIISTKAPLLAPNNQVDFLAEHGIDLLGTPSKCFLAAPMLVGDRVVGVISMQDYENENVYDLHHMELLGTLAAQGAIALENARLFEETRRRLQELTAVAEVSSSLRIAQTRAEMLPVILDQLIGLFKADGAAIAMYIPSSGETLIELGRGDWSSWTGLRLQPGEGISGFVIGTRQPFFTNDVRNDVRMTHIKLLGDLRAVACVPLIVHEKPIGAVWIGRRTDISPEDVRLLTAIGDMSANAINRAALFEQTELEVHHLTAMHAIDAAISNSFDLHLTMDVLLNQIITQLHVDATAISLLDPHSLTLEYTSQRGFRTDEITRSRMRLGEGYAGRVALERRTLAISDLRYEMKDGARLPDLKDEGFIAYYGVPLMAKGVVKGVLEIFHRSPLHPGASWLEFLEAMAGQAAIAVDNTQMFDDLQRSNLNLSLAYDATIKGWSNALDIRNKEVKGHNDRISEMTVRLARMVNMSDEELVNIRRGALLHDIGKMGVPDNILLKTVELTEEERAVLNQHPQLGYEMLSPIAYLRPALDIPYCHHEKWDGTGYPRGLKGEQIPLAARLFAVVDAWDTLRSERPYRRAMTDEHTLEFIEAGSGTQFDPKAVKLFKKALQEEGGRR